VPVTALTAFCTAGELDARICVAERETESMALSGAGLTVIDTEFVAVCSTVLEALANCAENECEPASAVQSADTIFVSPDASCTPTSLSIEVSALNSTVPTIGLSLLL